MWYNFLKSYKLGLQNRYIKGEYKFFVTKFDMCRRDIVSRKIDAYYN
ncbi:hypothetical protein SAMN06265377_2408 [Flagellimonas pacifica]|uniref:Uncharacterized protein n=1 Tax=Flagellimonas pacifica TaxID=1247520 RepID=A0A285MTT2_9FLAO|nr:hypothetical protein SAMN06265377_2408 [Allomuricauda parva]